MRDITETMAFTHFNYLDLTTATPDEDVGAISSRSTPGTDGPTSPIDPAVQQKQSAIQELVKAAIIQKRSDLGFSQLMNSSPLGMAALSACQAMVEVAEPQSEQVYKDFRLAAKSIGYQGVEMGVAYY